MIANQSVSNHFDFPNFPFVHFGIDIIESLTGYGFEFVHGSIVSLPGLATRRCIECTERANYESSFLQCARCRKSPLAGEPGEPGEPVIFVALVHPDVLNCNIADIAVDTKAFCVAW